LRATSGSPINRVRQTQAATGIVAPSSFRPSH
jgi:hypothetical protein